jgi:hypothetical protein
LLVAAEDDSALYQYWVFLVCMGVFGAFWSIYNGSRAVIVLLNVGLHFSVAVVAVGLHALVRRLLSRGEQNGT